MLMHRPVQPITLLAARAPCTAACRPRPWCCSSWQPHRTAVQLRSVQGRHSAKNISKYIETRTTLTARGCSPLETGVRHHSAGMLFPRLSLDANTHARPTGKLEALWLWLSVTPGETLRSKNAQFHGAFFYRSRLPMLGLS